MLHLICWAEPACWEAAARISSRTSICSIAWSFFLLSDIVTSWWSVHSGDLAGCEQNVVWWLLWSVPETELPGAGPAKQKTMGPGSSSGVWAWSARLKQGRMIVRSQISTDWPHFYKLFKGGGREASVGFFSQGVALCHFQCKWNFILINYYPTLEFSEMGCFLFSSLFHLLPLTLNDCRFVISLSSSGYKTVMDVKDTYIMPLDLDLYSMLLLTKEKNIKLKCE